jgi:hypothetical protein
MCISKVISFVSNELNLHCEFEYTYKLLILSTLDDGMKKAASLSILQCIFNLSDK